VESRVLPVSLLADLGFMAAGAGLRAQADAIAGALSALQPTNEHCFLISMYARLVSGEYEEAERVLREQALRLNPESSMAKAFLALALHLQGRMSERNQLIDQVLAQDNASANALAKNLLDEPAPG